MTTSTIYLNGKRYVRETNPGQDWPSGNYRVYATFAYRGVPAEWPIVITYTIRAK